MGLFDNIVAYWKLEHDLPTQRDSGPYTMHGTRIGSVSKVATGVTNLGNGAQFTAGSGNYIHIPSAVFNKLRNNTTIGIVLRVDNYASNGCILTKTESDVSHSAGFRIDTSALYFGEGNANKFTLTTWVPADGNFHWIMISTANDGTMSCFIDGVARGTPVATGYFLFANDGNLRMGAPENTFFGSGTASAAVTIGEVAFWAEQLDVNDNIEWYNSGQGYSLPEGTITLDGMGDFRTIQRDKDGSDSKTVTCQGYYTDTAIHSLEYAVYDYTTPTTLVQDWTAATVLSLNTTEKRWQANLNLPVHTDYCRYKVRSKNASNAVLETGELSNGRVGVGVVYLAAGQSNMANTFALYGTTSPNSRIGIFDNNVWSRTVSFDGSTWNNIGAGGGILLHRLQLGHNCPVGVIQCAIGGTGLVSSSGSGYWLDTATGSPYALSLIDIAASGGDFEGILWHQGESDAFSGNSKAAYKAGLTTLYGRYKALLGRTSAQLSFGVGSIGPLNDGTSAANICAIRDAATEWGYENFKVGGYYMGSVTDVTLADQYHYNSAGYQRASKRWAHSTLAYKTTAPFAGGGPFARWGWWSDTDNIVRLIVDRACMNVLKEADGSTDGGSLTGWEISDDNFSTTETITVTAFSGNEIHFTVPTLVTGATVRIRYQYAAVPNITNPVYGDLLPDGDTIGFPLIPISSAIIVPEVIGAAPTEPPSPLVTPLSHPLLLHTL